MANQPTDQPIEVEEDVPSLPPQPSDYVSIRLTVGENQFERFRSFMGDVLYIAYPHKGRKGDNPHYHILVLSTKTEMFRKRIKDNMGLVGNKYVACKLQRNGLFQGIQYCSRERTEPFVSDDSLLAYIAAAPAWIQQTIKTDAKTGKCLDKDWQLTYANLVIVAVKHARDNSMIDSSLKKVVADLIDSTKWRPSKWLICGGVPEFYENDFLQRLGKRKDVDMSWWTPRI